MYPWTTSINMGQVRLAPACGAPDCLVCTGYCQVPRLAQPTNMPLSGKLSAPRQKFTGLSGMSPNCPLSPRPMVNFANGRLPSGQKGQKVRNGHRKSVAPDCPVRHRGRRIQRSTPTSDWRGRHRTMLCLVCTGLSGAPVDKKVQPTAIMWLGPINTPNHHHSMYPNLLLLHIQYKIKESIPRHIQKLPISSSATIKTSDH
jgi:hypothetical protein